jgi:pimeloyl-ACP methyl ester carboxylesterase
MLDVGGHRIFVVAAEAPARRAVLLLHGFPTSSYDWHGVAARIAEHVPFVAFDFLGFGVSDKPDQAYSLFDQADIAEAVASACGIEQAVVVSHDMGDTVASELAHRSTAGDLAFEMEQLILTNGSIFIDMAHLTAGQQGLLALPDARLDQDLPPEGLRAALAELFSKEHPASSTDLEAMVGHVRHHDGHRLMPRTIRYIEERRAHQQRWTQALAGFAGPVTALWGEQDPIAVVAMMDRLREVRPDADIVTWPDVSHWPSLEVPDRVADAILSRVE